MSEIEKKYSDYQQSECEAFEQSGLEPMDEKLCPTCEIDPNFKLDGNWWEIEDAYLNKLYCEYHVRVYERERAVEEVRSSVFDKLEDKVKHIAAGRILVDLDKPLNNGTRTQVQNACYIKDTYRDLRSAELGETYLVAVPAFNFDQIPSNEDGEDAGDDENDVPSSEEIILTADGLFRKLRQLRLALRTYGLYYRSVQSVGGGFVIRQEADETRRMDYRNTVQNLKKFIDDLHDAMRDRNYAKLNRPGFFRRKRAAKIKIIFKDNGVPFDLKSIWILPDDGCDKYEKLRIKKSSALRKARMRPIYNFLQNLDTVINDITAKETKPWLDFTIDNFYPEYIVDYGNVGNLDDTRSGLECLLQDKLGIGNGQIIDSLSKEIMSAFESYANEMSKEICKAAKEDRDPPSPTVVAEQREEKQDPAAEERETALKAQYEKEYINKFYNGHDWDGGKWLGMERELEIHGDMPPGSVANMVDGVWEEGFREYNEYPEFPTPRIYYTNSEGEPAIAGNFSSLIDSEEQMLSVAKRWANNKFNYLQESPAPADGKFLSPHFQEALDAAKEELKNPENTFIQGFKDAWESRSELDVLDTISAFGVCGMTKTAGKALECLAGGVSFDRFLGILIDKAFDFIEINSLSLFMNGLPIDFREALNEEMEKQFGNISLSDIFELKKAENPNQKVKDFSTTKTKAKRLLELTGKLVNEEPRTDEENKFIRDTLGGSFLSVFKGTDFFNQAQAYDFGTGDVKKDAEKKLLKLIKSKMREHKKKEISAGIERIKDSLVITSDEPEELDKFTQSMKSFEETSLGVKVDAVFDVIIDFAIDYALGYFGIDDLLARLQNYPIVDFVAGLIDKYLDTCGAPPIIYPPPGDFLKGLSVDICDPSFSLALPKINIPSINLKFLLEAQFNEVFREAIIKLVSEIGIKILQKLLSTLEGALCNLLEAAGGFAADALKNGLPNTMDGLLNSFYDALNEAFCNDGENPATAEARAKELADALFSPLLFDAGMDYEGSGARVANVISSVASTQEFLQAMVAGEGQEDDHFNRRIASAINALSPEMAALLGDPSQVAYFFRNLGSHLTPEDRERIKDLLAAGIPNLPLSPALCLTNDQLNEWNDFRNQLLQDPFGDGSGRGGLTPEQAADRVGILNDQTEKALEDIFDIVGDLDTDGPFIGSITNEALKDVCNPNNVINTSSQSQFDKEQEDELTEAFFDNIQRSLANGFFGRGGILGEALRDTENRREFFRGFFKRFNGNYTNSQTERDSKFASKNLFGKFLMSAMVDPDLPADQTAIGVYPETVAIIQRNQIIDETAQNFKFNNDGKNVTEYSFSDSSDDFEYKLTVRANNSIKPKNSFDYRLRVDENTYEAGLFGGDEDSEKILDFKIPVPVSAPERSFFTSQGFQLSSNQNSDVRKELFIKMMQNKVSVSRSFAGNLYEQMYESINKNLSSALFTDSRQSDEIPVGYKFGYMSDTLTKDSFKYTPNDDPEKLGRFNGHPRVVALDPGVYGGSYKRPAYYVEPRQFFGWVELGTKAFGSPDGCEPKRPPLFDMRDVKERVKTLNSSLREDPRMSKPPDCVNEKPFHLLLDKKNKAKLDGVIRTTIRTFLGEYFIKGYGLFSNLQIRPDNFDQSMILYLVNKMKSEMQEIGVFTSNKKIRIVRERYWYTFLEQCVEAYQRMIDVDGITPPEDVSIALNRIQIGIDKYRPVTKKVRKSMRKSDFVPVTGFSDVRKPEKNYDSIEVASQSNVDFTLQSVAFRLSEPEEREDFFDGGAFPRLQKRDIRFASLKKLNFFKKIYFIKVFEKEAILIMSELVKDELNRLASNVVDGISDKPYYYDLHRSFFGMLPNSTSRVGTNDFYTDKQKGTINTGLIPEVKTDNSTGPVSPSSEPQLIVESYVRLEEKANAPQFIRGRQAKYTGFVSLTNMEKFIDENLSLMEDSYLSDFFGNLSFTYETSLKKLFDKGFAIQRAVDRLIELNRNRGALYPQLIQDALVAYVSSQDFQDVSVIYDESFLLDGEEPEPVGTVGSTGVKYGMRLSVVLPNNLASQVPQDVNLQVKSRNERAYFFQDGTVSIPLVTSEIDVQDCKVENFDPFSGEEPYDLECLINKMVSDIEFQTLMDKVFNFKQSASMLAIYCMESLPAAIGRDESERNEVDEDPDVDDWDRVVNKFGKNFLRREFKSLYLANHPDGQSEDDDDDSERLRLLNFRNPLDFFSLPSVKLPWWLKRRIRINIYDANGQECADPKKDLQ